MAKSKKKIMGKEVKKKIIALATRPDKLRDFLNNVVPQLSGPTITDFSPLMGQPGTIVDIHGQNFGTLRKDNEVRVGGKQTTIIKASSSLLRVVTDLSTVTGPVEVRVSNLTAKGSHDFKVLPHPQTGSGNDGPPIFFGGEGDGQRGDVPSTGTLNVLVVLVNPSDTAPTNPTTARDAVVQAWNNVHTFYDQASYGRLNVQVTVTNSWHPLTGNLNDYVTLSGDPESPNIRSSVLGRLVAESAQAAVNDGFNLDNFAMMACVINLNGQFIRAVGGWSQQNFAYNDGAGTNINITVNHDLNLLAIQESADWGRFAHEFGHNIVSVPSTVSASPGAATLGEDVYASDLIDPNVATAQSFEMMGNHDSHPLFSAFNMDKLGYYNSTNILDLTWDRNAFNQEYDVVAHDLTENNFGGRYHLIKIRVGDGLYYYVEVRQRPGTTTQIFDGNIPLNGATQDGGVVVTKVLTGVMNMNQQMRFITLLHDPHVLKQGDIATDPARALKITLVNDHVSSRPLVCKVRIEWAQNISNDPNGAFDLRVEPWDGNWQTPDIWIDRMPFGTFDQSMDPQGRPQGNGDKPRPREVNHFWGRIHCDGAIDATNVRVTFYSVDPPGVGDNGNWAPLQTTIIPTVTANNYVDVNVNWVPVVGEHTCLKIWAEQQLGEISGDDNWAQENVFEFEAPASSVPDSVIMSVAVRNPLKQRTIVLMGIKGVPKGYSVHFPHSWLWLEPLEERRSELTIIPSRDYNWYRDRKSPSANVRLAGDIPRSYKEEILPGVLPGSRMFAIGGIMTKTTPKKRVNVKINLDKKNTTETRMSVSGTLSSPMGGEILRVDLIDPQNRLRVVQVKTDAQGRFNAIFDLAVTPSLEVKPKKQKEKPLDGIYKLQALIINSPNVAQTESNIVYAKKNSKNKPRKLTSK